MGGEREGPLGARAPPGNGRERARERWESRTCVRGWSRLERGKVREPYLCAGWSRGKGGKVRELYLCAGMEPAGNGKGTRAVPMCGDGPGGKASERQPYLCAGYATAGKGGERQPHLCQGWTRRESRRGTTAVAAPVMDPAGKEGNDSRICLGRMDPAGKDANDSRSAARDGPPPRRRHQPKLRSPAPGTESPMPRWQCPDGTLVPARHKIQASGKGTGSAGRVTPGTGEFCCPLFPLERTARSHRAASPLPPARFSDGRHRRPVSRRRRRTPEAEWSPIGSGVLRQGGTTGRRAGRVVGRSRMLVWGAPGTGPSGKAGCRRQPVVVGLLWATSAIKTADSVLSPAMAFCKRLIEGHFSCGKI
ncbi:uncharacterized protein GJ701_000235 [Geothlypis trichas]